MKTPNNPLRFTRRNLLRGSLAATAAFPLLEARRVDGADPAPVRFVVFCTPNGTRNNLFWPTGADGALTLKQLTAPLEMHKNKMTFLKGIRLNDSLQNGALGGTVGSEHARGTGGMLTGRPLKSGTQFKSFGNTTSGWGTGQSIDQFLAERLAPPTPHKSLQVGVHVRDAEVRARISYSGADRPVPPREDPADVFSALFSGVMTPTMPGTPTGMPDPALERLRTLRKSVFDITKGETERLLKVLGTEDRYKLEAHQASMRDVETRLLALPTMSGGSGTPTSGGAPTCAPPMMETVNLNDDTIYEKAGKLQMDLVAAALACDQTRIATIQWSFAESEHLFQFLSINGNHHDISHDFSQMGSNFDAYNTIQAWYASQLAYFLGKLDSYVEGDRTLLDNTLVLWATEIGESTQHDLTLMPYVFAGSAGGKIKTGRLVDYGNTKQDNNQMLVTIAQLMGAEDVTEFGDPSGAKGPLPSLA
jgi:hypothetical protein